MAKKNVCAAVITEEESARLNYVADKLEISKSEFIRKAINEVYESFKEEEAKEEKSA